MTDISTRQHQEQYIRRLAAQRHYYSLAKRILTTQMSLAVGTPVASAVIVRFCDESIPWLVLGGILIAFLIHACLDPLQRRHRMTAARIQEDFDCHVLELPWDSFLVGRQPRAADIYEAAKSAGSEAEAQLRNWYPLSVDSLPIHQARVICQMTNCSWDARLRRLYRSWIYRILALIGVLMIVSCYGLEMNLPELAVFVAAPLVPTFLLGLAEARRHGQAADEEDRLRDLIDCRGIGLTHNDLSECEAKRLSRELQNAIYLRRRASPLVWDWFYRRRREAYEEQMRVEAEDMVAKLKTQLESD